MDNESQIYVHLQCRKCECRLSKPIELDCKHLICCRCLEIILRNHRRNTCCPTCKQLLGVYEIDNYSFLPATHWISRMLSTFSDVNRCETCGKFTTVQNCSKCSKHQCGTCFDQHTQIHNEDKKNVIDNDEKLSKEEMEILEKIKDELTENEYENFVQVARQYIASVTLNKNDQPDNIENQPIWTENKFYDWSKHEKLTANTLAKCQPERVKDLLRLGFVPRPYQIRMMMPALQRKNILICLQTGAGKTFVAGMVAKFFHIQSIQNNDNQAATFKVLFLVPIKALVDQQCAAFRKVFIDQPDRILKTIDNQSGERFPSLYNQYDVFFITTQKFANFIESNHADLTKFDLIIIDECHHCYDNHPINSLMRHYHSFKLKGSRVPQIIGLTASVGTNKTNAFKHLVHLCANLDCLEISAIIYDVDEEELRNSTNTPLGDIISTVLKKQNDVINSKVKDDIMMSISTHLGFDISTMNTQELEQYLTKQYDAACKACDREAIIGLDYLRHFQRFLVYYEDLPLEHCMKWLKENLNSVSTNPTQFDTICRRKLEMFDEYVSTSPISNLINNKLQKLIEIIIRVHTSDCRGLVLVRTKYHTVALEKFLNQQPELQRHQIIAGRLTGQGSIEEHSLPAGQQATILEQFRKGKINLLIATDVAQEGLDVAECSYVIRYEFVSNEIGTVQSRGRARAVQSKCFLITEELSTNYLRELENREKENETKKAIEEWRKLGISEFKKRVKEEQEKILQHLLKISKSRETSSQEHQMPAETITCRFCDEYLCNGSSLRWQGTTVVCADKQFESHVKPSQLVGAKINCPNATCHKELGAVLLLSRNVFGYTLYITSIKFYYKDQSQAVLYKKWSSYKGYIEPL